MKVQQPTAADTVPRALGHLRMALDDAYARVSRELDLTPSQAELLCAALHPTPVGLIAQVLRCDRTNVTHLVDRAVERGWVKRQRHQSDRRQSLIALTAEGRWLASRFIARLEDQLAPLLMNWSEKQQHSAVATLNELADELDRNSSNRPRPAARQ